VTGLKEVSVVISTYAMDRLSSVLACIESLKRQTLLPKDVILVLDPDQKLIEFYKSRVPDDVKIVVSEGYGLSHARNAGVKNAEGEIVAFIDDDAVADEKWLENLVKNYDDPHIVGVGGFVEPMWERDRPMWFPEELDWMVGCSYKGLPKCKTYVRNPIGCNMSFREDVFDRVGYFRVNIGRIATNLISGEDTEFSIRILQNLTDSRIVYDPSAIVYHRVPRTRVSLKYLMKRAFYGGFSVAVIVNSIKSNPINVLSVEDRYLRYLLKVSIPLRVKRVHELKNILQLFALLTSIFLVLVGYFFGRLRK
jgi:GT2 family glycosyltransferase